MTCPALRCVRLTDSAACTGWQVLLEQPTSSRWEVPAAVKPLRGVMCERVTILVDLSRGPRCRYTS